MPAQPPSPGRQHDHTLLNSSPSNHRQPENQALAEQVVKLPELPMPSSSLSEVDKDEEQRLKHVAAAVKQDSDSSLAVADEEELPEFVYIDLQVIRKEVQCPICLGIIKKTRTVMECLHRFCRECIDKSMRMGNNECPACRTHCASRRSLRDDSRYDALIAALFPDIENFEAEELAFCEEEKSRNKQIQASIAQISKRQLEALGKKRCYRGIGSQRNVRETPSRRSKRKRSGKTEFESEDDEDSENIEGQTSSYSGDQYKEDQHRQISKRHIVSSHSFSTATSSGGLCIESRLEHRRSYHGIMWNIEMQTWGRNGVRSGHVRKNPQSTHLAKFEFLQKFVKKDGQNASFLTACKAADKQLLAAKEPPQAQGNNKRDTLHLSSSIDDDKGRLSDVVNQFRDGLQLSEEKILPGFEANSISHGGQVILSCQQKETL